MTVGEVRSSRLLGAQEGILFAQQLVPESPIFNIGQVVWFDRRLDARLLDEAVRIAISESDVLLASLTADDGGARWESAGAPRELPTAVHDHSGDATPRRSALARMHDDLATPRELSGRDLVGSAYHVLGEDSSAWFFRAHHVLLDAYGLMLVSRRVAELYTALAGGKPPRPRWFGTFDDLVAEEAATRDGQAGSREFWIGKVDGRSAQRVQGTRRSEGAHDYLRPPLRRTVTLGETVRDRLKQCAAEHKLTWGDVVIAGWGTYLAKITGSTHVVPGLPLMCRSTPAALRTPAVKVNILPLHIDVDESATVAETLRRFADEVALARTHQGYRREHIAREAGLVGTDGRLSGSQVNIKAFDYHLAFGDVTGVQQGLSTGPVDDLSLSAYFDATHGLRFDLDANGSTFDGPSVDRHLGRFAAYFAEFVTAASDRKLGTVRVATEADRRQVTGDWNLGPRPSGPGTLISLLDAQFRAAAADPAVVFRGETMTYAELDAAANRLSRELLAAGIGPGTRVAVALPRSHGLIVALVAVIRTGAAYVPVDTAYPGDRIRYMLENSGARRVVASKDSLAQLGESVPDDMRDAVLVVDDPATKARVAARSADPVPDAERGGPVLPQAPAYVIYTSGTTGRPKGVVLSHRSIVNRLLWGQAQLFALSHRDRVLQKAPISFDVSVTEIFGTMAAGATIVLAEPGAHGDPAHLFELMRDEQVTLTNFVPSMLQAFLESGPDPSRLAVRAVVCSGEALSRKLSAELGDRFGIAAWNTYGPTETGEVTYHRVDLVGPGPEGGIEPLGRFGANCGGYILDRFLQPVPAGVPGELYLTGPQLANGYHGRPGLTAGRFVADPFGAPGERMYRTGDLAQWSEHGTILYLGRNDDQIKIRGFRVELAEIAAVIGAAAGVGNCVVVPKTAPSGALVLVAYLVAGPGAAVVDLPAAARDAARENLPDHMVPSFFVTVDRIPMTPNGKLDRRALPEPDFEVVEGSRPAETDAERRVVKAFEEVLGLSKIGADDDFFQLGGHSLLATRLVTRLSEEFAVKVSIRVVFDNPTVSQLAAALD
ncbi:non-ribosomal peptide synthetase [Amycolatopsis alba]|nr:non-ribosomal peptide synthetase [Amycolatopsis alba]